MEEVGALGSRALGGHSLGSSRAVCWDGTAANVQMCCPPLSGPGTPTWLGSPALTLLLLLLLFLLLLLCLLLLKNRYWGDWAGWDGAKYGAWTPLNT